MDAPDVVSVMVIDWGRVYVPAPGFRAGVAVVCCVCALTNVHVRISCFAVKPPVPPVNPM
jgi:hypothetical protein